MTQPSSSLLKSIKQRMLLPRTKRPHIMRAGATPSQRCWLSRDTVSNTPTSSRLTQAGKTMYSLEFATADRIIFGAGKLNELGKQMEEGAKRLLLVRGRSSDAISRVKDILSKQGIQFIEFEVHGEPTVEVVRQGVNVARDCDMVIGLGGGSVLDTGKAIATLVTNPGDVFDYLEVVGKGQPLIHASLPYIAIPTTAGTGSEVTRNAVIESTEQKVKVSLRSPLMLPRIALVDPELTYSLPAAITATSGLDALTQLIEP